MANPYRGVLVFPATMSGAPNGVAVKPVAANEFGWIQNGGVAVVLAEGAIIAGAPVVAGVTTAGAVAAFAASGTTAVLGIAAAGIADTEYGAVNLNLP